MSIRTSENWNECEAKLSKATDDYLAGRITVEEFHAARDMYGIDYRRMFEGLARVRRERSTQEKRRRYPKRVIEFMLRTLRGDL